MTPVEALKAARALIADESRWTKGHMARGPYGELRDANAPEAVCWCAVGAIRKVTETDDEDTAARRLLQSAIPSGDWIAEFNDRVNHADVLRLFDRAISKATGTA
jgi:hypothetical protein